MSTATQPVVLAVLPDEEPVFAGYRHEDFLGRMPSIGLLYLAAVLEKHGHQVITIDCQADHAALDRLAHTIAAHQPALVGFTLYDGTLSATLEVIRELRTGYAGPIVVGGYTPTFHADDILRNCPEVDFVIVREGEHAVVALMEHLRGGRDIKDVPNLVYRSDSGLQHNPEGPLVDVRALPRPRRQWPEKGDVTPIVTRRGCSSRCSFCSMVPFYDIRLGPIVRIREPVDVVDEIADCIDHGSIEFMIYDDDFSLSTEPARKWCDRFIEEVQRRSLDFHFGIELRVTDVIRGAALLGDLCGVGLTHLSIGMESMLPRQLKLYNKGYQQQHIFEAIEIARGLPADFQTNVIFWDPWITMEEAVEHVGLLDSIDIQDQLGSANSPFCANKLDPRRGTKIFEIIEGAGLLRLTEGTFHIYDWDFVDPGVRAFMRRTYLRFLLNFRRVPRPPALWLAVPRMEQGGKNELAADIRKQASVMARAEFSYFAQLVRSTVEARCDDPHKLDRATAGVHREWAPRVDAAARKLVELGARAGMRAGQPATSSGSRPIPSH